MNNFRRRASAKTQRTVVSTSRVLDIFKATSVNITNGTFRINRSNGSTADLSITITYTATTSLKTVYSDGTSEKSNTITSSGTCVFTKATLYINNWFGNHISISSNVTLSDGQEMLIILCDVPFFINDGMPLTSPANQGGEVEYNCIFTTYSDYINSPGYTDVKVYIANTGTLYYVDIYK